MTVQCIIGEARWRVRGPCWSMLYVKVIVSIQSAPKFDQDSSFFLPWLSTTTKQKQQQRPLVGAPGRTDLVVRAEVLVLLHHLQLPALPHQHGPHAAARQVRVQLRGKDPDAPLWQSLGDTGRGRRSKR